MATSLFKACGDQVSRRRQVKEMNLNGSEETTRPDQNVRKCGRKKSKTNEGAQKKNKQPQRGMGVAQLERLRTMQPDPEQNPNPNPSPFHPFSIHNHHFLPSQFVHDQSVNKLENFGAMNNGMMGLNQHMFVQRVGNGGFVGRGQTNSGLGMVFPDNQFQMVDANGSVGTSNLCFRPTASNLNMIKTETSKELSSIPNRKCYSEHCGVCHKNLLYMGLQKKRMDGEISVCNEVYREPYPDTFPSSSNTSMGLINSGNKTNIYGQNQQFGTKLPAFNQYADLKTNLQSEMRGVRRNGNSGGGNSHVLMEYEFFPAVAAGKSSSFEEWFKLGSESSSSVAAAVGGEASCLTTTTTNTISIPGFGASSGSIDLSLKLSY